MKVLSAFFVLVVLSSRAVSVPGGCDFDTNRLEFVGTPVEQARCLLRPPLVGGGVGQPLTELPAPLEQLIGQPSTISRDALRRYLDAHYIAEGDIGGPITNVLRAKYFVIHDTSTPNYTTNSIPENINSPSWKYNDVTMWKKSPVAHVFVGRTGKSFTAHPFIVPWRATKFESKVITREQSRGLFVHVENTMPRHSDPKSFPSNDALAPKPGFTDAMLDRVALLYLTASMEHGRWMVPCYHAALDAGLPDAHDDPQNFDLKAWAAHLDKLIREIGQ